jgi:hypothetical protein
MEYTRLVNSLAFRAWHTFINHHWLLLCEGPKAAVTCRCIVLLWLVGCFSRRIQRMERRWQWRGIQWTEPAAAELVVPQMYLGIVRYAVYERGTERLLLSKQLTRSWIAVSVQVAEYLRCLKSSSNFINSSIRQEKIWKMLDHGAGQKILLVSFRK